MSLFRSLRICNVLYSKKPRITGNDREAIATIADVMVSDRFIIASCNEVGNLYAGIDWPLCVIYRIEAGLFGRARVKIRGLYTKVARPGLLPGLA